MYPDMSGNQHLSQTSVATNLYVAAALRDATESHIHLHPSQGKVAVAVNNGRIVAAGLLGEVEHAIDSGPVKRIDLPDCLLLPGLVNTHTHLDLTDIGPRPYTGNFIDWVKMVMANRPTDPKAIHAAVNHGLKLSRQAGTLTIGDIAGSLHAIQARLKPEQDPPPPGYSWLECFGFGDEALAARPDLKQLDPIKHWIEIQYQPHAPYSAGIPLFEDAGLVGLELASTHLAETHEELEFVRDATGPFAELLKGMGKWHDSIKPTGLTPIEYLKPVFELAYMWVLAHCNYVTDSDIEYLANKGFLSVAYCPRASDYFGHRNHRYRDMIEAGVNVSLGTDSIICHQSLSILDEMRHLYHRDRTDPHLLLKMATTNGANALTMIDIDTTLSRNASPGLIAIPYDHDPKNTKLDPLQQILAQDQAPHVKTLELPQR